MYMYVKLKLLTFTFERKTHVHEQPGGSLAHAYVQEPRARIPPGRRGPGPFEFTFKHVVHDHGTCMGIPGPIAMDATCTSNCTCTCRIRLTKVSV